MADLRKLIASMDKMNEAEKPVVKSITEGSMLKGLNMMTKSVAPAAEMAKEYKKFVSESDAAKKTCPQCHGKGTIRAGASKCPRCNGSGKVGGEKVDEGYWDEVMAKTEKSRAERAGKPFEKNPASHDKNGVYVGDKDLAGRKLPRGGYSDEAHPIIDGSNERVTEDVSEPNVDDILYYLTSAYRHLQQNADFYQDFSVITRIYENLRYDLKAGDYHAFQKTYEDCLGRYPDASVELFDAMFVEAGLPEEQGTIEQFIEKCSGVNEGIGSDLATLGGITAVGIGLGVGAGNLDKHEVTTIQGTEFIEHEMPEDKSNVKLTTDDHGNKVYAWVQQTGMKPRYTYHWYAPVNKPKVVKQEGIGDTIKRGVKSVKRGMQGWGDGVTPAGIKDRASKYTNDEVAGMAKGYDELRKTRATLPTSTDVPKHSPAGLQKRVLDREMKKRGMSESYGVFSRTDESAPIKTFALKEDAVAMAKRYNKINPTEGIKYVVRNIAEAMPAAIATATSKMNPAANSAPTPATGAPTAPSSSAPKAPGIVSPTSVDPAVAKAQQAAYQRNLNKLKVPGLNAAQVGASMQKQADDMQLTPTDNANNAKITKTLANVMQDPTGAQQLKTLTDKYAKKPGQQ